MGESKSDTPLDLTFHPSPEEGGRPRLDLARFAQSRRSTVENRHLVGGDFRVSCLTRTRPSAWAWATSIRSRGPDEEERCSGIGACTAVHR